MLRWISRPVFPGRFRWRFLFNLRFQDPDYLPEEPEPDEPVLEAARVRGGEMGRSRGTAGLGDPKGFRSQDLEEKRTGAPKTEIASPENRSVAFDGVSNFGDSDQLTRST